MKWFFWQVKKNNLIALNYFIWEESKPEHMRRTIDSQILFIESCRFFIFDTLFQEFTFCKKKNRKVSCRTSTYSYWLTQLHSIHCSSVKTTSCSTNVTFQSFLVVKGQHRNKKQSNAINCSHGKCTLIVTMATVARDISYIW